MPTGFEIAFPPIDASICVTGSDQRILDHVAHQLSTPGGVATALHMTLGAPEMQSRVVGEVRIETTGSGRTIAVTFSGSASTETYSTTVTSIAADTYSVLLTVLQTALIKQDLIAVHAAFIDVDGKGVLVAGGSGSGKTSIAVEASRRGLPAYSSELSIVADGYLHLGESSVTIGQGAIDKFNLSLPTPTQAIGPDWLVLLPALVVKRKIDLVVFPRVGLVPTSRARIARRAAEVAAFECATSQAPLWRLVGNRSQHVNVHWDSTATRTTIAQAFRLCDEPTWHIEGIPQAVVDSLVEIVAGALA